jgi:Zn ribbon nucleic-acid-binding protein
VDPVRFWDPGFSFDKLVSISETNAIGSHPHLSPLAMEACNHPRVRVLTREEDAEFVECLECGEVFDSHEFADMAIEERTQQEKQKEAAANPEV